MRPSAAERRPVARTSVEASVRGDVAAPAPSLERAPEEPAVGSPEKPRLRGDDVGGLRLRALDGTEPRVKLVDAAEARGRPQAERERVEVHEGSGR